MRIEKRFAAMGHELDGEVTPLEAGLDFAVAWQSDFIGRDALLQRREAGPAARLATALLADRDAQPLGHEPIRLGGEIIGETTSAAFGYRIGRPLALGYVRLPDPEGAAVEIDIAGDALRPPA